MARGECFAAFRSASRIAFGRPPGLPDWPCWNRVRVGGHGFTVQSSPVLRQGTRGHRRRSQASGGTQLHFQEEKASDILGGWLGQHGAAVYCSAPASTQPVSRRAPRPWAPAAALMAANPGEEIHLRLGRHPPIRHFFFRRIRYRYMDDLGGQCTCQIQ